MTEVEIRLPELGGGTEAEQLRRMQSYLYALASQLQYAFDGVSREQSAVRTQLQAGEKQEKNGNFGAIKSLIIRSAEITEHFSQEIEKRLEGSFVAQSQFGTFRQETEQRMMATDSELRQEFLNLQQITSELAEVRDSLLEVSASIRTGLLYYADSGAPVYGVEIGQQERENDVVRFHKFARLTSDKLSFYDSNDVEVAYISDRTLYVTDANVRDITAQTAGVNRLRIGDYFWTQGADGHLSLQ